MERAYMIGKKLGEGGFGIVYRGWRQDDGAPVAIKRLYAVKEWAKGGDPPTPLEVIFLERVKHVPGVVKLLSWGRDAETFYLVFERPAPCLDLFAYVELHGALSEKCARDFFRQLVTIVLEVHGAGVVHRDLKDENILIELGTGKVYLIDFGIGAWLHDYDYTGVCGTRVYSPPEWIRESRYRAEPAAVWSLGVILFNMLTGDIPFVTDIEIQNACLDFPAEYSISEPCQDLIRRCLSVNEKKRPGLKGVLEHPWVSKQTQGGSGFTVEDSHSKNTQVAASTAVKKQAVFSKTRQIIVRQDSGLNPTENPVIAAEARSAEPTRGPRMRREPAINEKNINLQ
ncbi:serine/threonine-protein kinase pim-1-like [Elysia marginata]|uniref:Serine/threonine-protein kinase 1 n=1 Tax=Elysia marginata TaxID=1093978 RepID=A0AAV4GTH2_9GAST|nr:serine/threonine-protein kinase pim-1-like [Elysia marginata]